MFTENTKINLSERGHFSLIDYSVLASLLITSSLIGLYYGFIAKKRQNNTLEYFQGGKEITLFPISMSLIAQHISGTTLLGAPMEIYAFGTQFWISILSALTVPLSIQYIFYPIFYDLKLLSTFMYFEKRFNRTVRLIGSAVSLWGIIIFLPAVIYIPALAFNQVSGVNVHVTTPIICIVCIIYTTIGGLRTVVWTDAIQLMLMVLAVLLVILLGIFNLKNLMDIWNAADRGGRLIFFDMNPNPLVRTSAWTFLFGLTTTYISALGAAQSCIQKLLSVPDHKTTIASIWIYSGGIILFKIFGILIGLIMFANYENCDPHTAGIVEKLDQVLPYFVMQVGDKIPGLPGLFIAGIFSAAMSTMSGLLNTMSCMIYDDFLRARLHNRSEQEISTILKVIVFALGMITLALVSVIEKLGTIYQLVISLTGLAAGTVLGLFTAGMLSRKFNTKGVSWGAVVSVLLVASITIGAQTRPPPAHLPMSTEDCHIFPDSLWSPKNSSLSPTTVMNQTLDDTFWLFRISFMYYSLIGCATVWIIGLPISLIWQTNEVVEEHLLAPFLRKKILYSPTVKYTS